MKIITLFFLSILFGVVIAVFLPYTIFKETIITKNGLYILAHDKDIKIGDPIEVSKYEDFNETNWRLKKPKESIGYKESYCRNCATVTEIRTDTVAQIKHNVFLTLKIFNNGNYIF